MILSLWTNTSDLPQVRRRFSLTYPQAIAVRNSAQIDPIVTPPRGSAVETMGSNCGGSVLRRIAEYRLRKRQKCSPLREHRGAGAGCR